MARRARSGRRCSCRRSCSIRRRTRRSPLGSSAGCDSLPVAIQGSASRDGERSIEFTRIYGWRWHIGLDFRAIKAVMQMDVLRCKTPAMIEKEVAAHLLAYNLVHSVMAQAAALTTLLPRQLSFKGALRQLRAFERILRHGERVQIDQAHNGLLISIAELRVPQQPGRLEPRALKRRGIIRPSQLSQGPRHGHAC